MVLKDASGSLDVALPCSHLCSRVATAANAAALGIVEMLERFAARGIPVPRRDHAEATAEMALAMQKEVAHHDLGTGKPLQLRIGINSGPIVAGVIGTAKLAYALWGETVNIAARMEAYGLPGGIQVTAETYERLRRNYRLEDRGKVYVKGKGLLRTYLLLGRKGPGV